MQRITDTRVINHVARYGNTSMSDGVALALLKERAAAARARFVIALVLLGLYAAFVYSTPYTHADITRLVVPGVVAGVIASLVVAYLIARALRAHFMVLRAMRSLALNAAAESHLVAA